MSTPQIHQFPQEHFLTETTLLIVVILYMDSKSLNIKNSYILMPYCPFTSIRHHINAKPVKTHIPFMI